jgi:hypothetical protein
MTGVHPASTKLPDCIGKGAGWLHGSTGASKAGPPPKLDTMWFGSKCIPGINGHGAWVPCPTCGMTWVQPTSKLPECTGKGAGWHTPSTLGIMLPGSTCTHGIGIGHGPRVPCPGSNLGAAKAAPPPISDTMWLGSKFMGDTGNGPCVPCTTCGMNPAEPIHASKLGIGGTGAG